ncbi:MAG: GNAT family protein [Bacteroidetes bacterium]|nr:GNAT family protein [Bacteroidota bacterium]
MRMLETRRFLLKPVEERDLNDLLELQWDREVIRLMSFKPISYENQKEWLKSIGTSKLFFSVFEKNSDNRELVGLASLNQIDNLHQRASWGLKLKANLQSKGIGYEVSLILLHFAFSNLNLVKIHGDRIAENIGSIKLCSKLGFREEGVLIKHYFKNGIHRNLTLVGILKEEFYEHNLEKLRELDLIDEY